MLEANAFPSAYLVTVVSQRGKVAGTSLEIADVVKTGGEGSLELGGVQRLIWDS